MKYSIPIAILIMIIGIVIIITALVSPMMLQLKIALALAGAALISSGLIQLGQAQDKKQDKKWDEEKHQRIMDKLEKIEEELTKLEQPKNTGVVIADVLASGLKYYSEHLNKPEKEEKKE